MDQQPDTHVSPFEAIRRETEGGSTYWGARELAKILGYTEYGKFSNAIKKAEEACKNSGQAVSDHFAHVSDMIGIGKGAKRKVSDVHLSRYACYLLIQILILRSRLSRSARPISLCRQTAYVAPFWTGSMQGSVRKKVEPTPSLDWNQRWPPCRSTSSRQR